MRSEYGILDVEIEVDDKDLTIPIAKETVYEFRILQPKIFTMDYEGGTYEIAIRDNFANSEHIEDRIIDFMRYLNRKYGDHIIDGTIEFTYLEPDISYNFHDEEVQ